MDALGRQLGIHAARSVLELGAVFFGFTSLVMSGAWCERQHDGHDLAIATWVLLVRSADDVRFELRGGQLDATWCDAEALQRLPDTMHACAPVFANAPRILDRLVERMARRGPAGGVPAASVPRGTCGLQAAPVPQRLRTVGNVVFYAGTRGARAGKDASDLVARECALLGDARDFGSSEEEETGREWAPRNTRNRRPSSRRAACRRRDDAEKAAEAERYAPGWANAAKRVREAAAARIPAVDGQAPQCEFDRAVLELHGLYEEEEDEDDDDATAMVGRRCVYRAEPDEDAMHRLAVRRGVFDTGHAAPRRQRGGFAGAPPTWSAPPSPPSVLLPAEPGGMLWRGRRAVVWAMRTMGGAGRAAMGRLRRGWRACCGGGYARVRESVDAAGPATGPPMRPGTPPPSTPPSAPGSQEKKRMDENTRPQADPEDDEFAELRHAAAGNQRRRKMPRGAPRAEGTPVQGGLRYFWTEVTEGGSGAASRTSMAGRSAAGASEPRKQAATPEGPVPARSAPAAARQRAVRPDRPGEADERRRAPKAPAPPAPEGRDPAYPVYCIICKLDLGKANLRGVRRRQLQACHLEETPLCKARVTPEAAAQMRLDICDFCGMLLPSRKEHHEWVECREGHNAALTKQDRTQLYRARQAAVSTAEDQALRRAKERERAAAAGGKQPAAAGSRPAGPPPAPAGATSAARAALAAHTSTSATAQNHALRARVAGSVSTAVRRGDAAARASGETERELIAVQRDACAMLSGASRTFGAERGTADEGAAEVPVASSPSTSEGEGECAEAGPAGGVSDPTATAMEESDAEATCREAGAQREPQADPEATQPVQVQEEARGCPLRGGDGAEAGADGGARRVRLTPFSLEADAAAVATAEDQRRREAREQRREAERARLGAGRRSGTEGTPSEDGGPDAQRECEEAAADGGDEATSAPQQGGSSGGEERSAETGQSAGAAGSEQPQAGAGPRDPPRRVPNGDWTDGLLNFFDQPRFLDNLELHLPQSGLLRHLGPLDQAAACAVVLPIQARLAQDVGCVAAWIAHFAVGRMLFAPAPPQQKTVEVIAGRCRAITEGRVAEVWNEVNWAARLPTVKAWQRHAGMSEEQRRQGNAARIRVAVFTYDTRSAMRVVDDVPSAPPGTEQRERQIRLLCAVDPEDKALMRADYSRRGYDRLWDERVTRFYERLQAAEDWETRLLRKWGERLGLARIKRAPGATGVRTEHRRPFYERDMRSAAIIAEAVEENVVPGAAQRLLATVLVQCLLKKDEHGRYGDTRKVRPIGRCDRLLADCKRARAMQCATLCGAVMARMGIQYSIGVKSGGEAVANAVQLRCDYDRNVVTAFADMSNAFPRADMEQTFEALGEFEDMIRAKPALAGDNLQRTLEAIDYVRADLVFYRTHHGEGLLLVDGKMELLPLPVGNVMGGLFSMFLYACLTLMKVFVPLQQKLGTRVQPRCIADDCTVQMSVSSVEDVRSLAEWLTEYDRLARAIKMKNNIGKFVLLQAPEHTGAAFDIEAHLALFPRDAETRKSPRVERGAHEVNGVAVGFSPAARSSLALVHVKALEERNVSLLQYAPLVGEQVVELLFRQSFSPRSVLNHLARGTDLEASRPALLRADALTARADRALFHLPDDLVPDAPFTATGDRRVEESLHLGVAHGGMGHKRMTIEARNCRAGNVVDTLPLLRAMPDVGHLIPPAGRWEESPSPMLRDTMTTLREAVKTNAFKNGPKRFPDAWKLAHAALLGANGEFDPEGVERLAQRHLQRVLSTADQQQMLEDLVTDDTLPPDTRARLRSASQFGSGAFFAQMALTADTELDPLTFVTSVQKRIGAPLSLLLLETRCLGCKLYSLAGMPIDPPCYIGRGERPRVLLPREHLDGTHWDSETAGGMVTARHNALCAILVALLRKMGYFAKQHEVVIGSRVGRDGVRRCVRLDATAKSGMAGSGRTIGVDVTVGAALRYTGLAAAAREDLFVCQRLTKKKRDEKLALALQNNYTLLVAAFDSLGAMAAELRDMLLEAYKARREQTQSEQEKWALAHELQHFLEKMQACIQRGNVSILLEMAHPLATGRAPEPTLPPTLEPSTEYVWEWW